MILRRGILILTFILILSAVVLIHHRRASEDGGGIMTSPELYRTLIEALEGGQVEELSQDELAKLRSELYDLEELVSERFGTSSSEISETLMSLNRAISERLKELEEEEYAREERARIIRQEFKEELELLREGRFEELRAKLKERASSELEGMEDNVELSEIAKADHIFSAQEALEMLRELIGG